MTKKVAILGGDIDGLAAARYWLAKGAQVTVHDRSDTIMVSSDMQSVLGPDFLKALSRYDLVVRGPGVKPRDIKTTTPVTTGVREFFQHCPARIIGVTGTRGKDATAALIARILEETGRRVWLGGPAGRSPLEFLGKIKASDVVVLELSSFQLMDLDISPHIAVCLMITSEHLDWHRNIREYIAAKGNIFWHQQAGDVAVYNPNNDFSMQIAQLSPGRKVPYLQAPGAFVHAGNVMMDGTIICATSEMPLAGPADLANACAAVTAASEIVGDKPEALRRALQNFTGAARPEAARE